MNGFFDPNKYHEQVGKVSEQYTRTPNFIIDDGIMAQLSDKVFKCYSLISRYTTGYNKPSAEIATSTFKKYCGIKKDDTVYACIRELEQLKLITVIRQKGVLNAYSLINNHSHEKVLPLEGTTPVKGEGTTPVKGEGTTPVKGDSYKENSKENFKESSSSLDASEKFEPQKNVMAGYAMYHSDDSGSYSLVELEQKYPDLEQDFLDQAQASFQSIKLTQAQNQELFTELRQWSLTKQHGQTPQRWMNSWLNIVKNNAYKFNEAPKKSSAIKSKTPEKPKHKYGTGVVNPSNMRDVGGSNNG